MSYTKGPWKLDDLEGIENISGECIATPCEPGITFPNDADIPIILAAPDMYEACKALIMHKHQGNIHPIDYQRIEQALSKAEGRS